MNQPVDPQSGNPIPPGGNAEGVRDNVDIKASEGEFIIPQNVVQFYGVKYLQGLVDKANERLVEMDQQGQIGGEEVPNPEKQLDSADTRAFAQGGLVDYMGNDPSYPGAPSNAPSFNPQDWSILGISQFMPSDTKTEVKNYVNARGQILPITFINGKPQQPIPEGFYPEGQLPANQQKELGKKEPVDTENNEATQGFGVGHVGEDAQPVGPYGGKNPFEMSREELAGAYDTMKNSYAKIDQFSALGSIHPLAAVGIQVAKANTISNMHRTALVAEARGDTTMADMIRKEVDDLTGNGFVGNILDRVASGKRRYEADRKNYLGAGNTINSFGASASSRTSGGTRDPISATSRYGGSNRTSTRSYDSGDRDQDTNAYSGGGGRATQHSSTPGDFTSSRSSSGGSSSSGGLSFGGRSSDQSRSKSNSQGTSYHSSTPGDFTSSRDTERSGGLSFRKGGLVTRPKK